MSFLQASALQLQFGERKILRNISFTLGPMSKVALVGLNGAGKTTLMKVLTGRLSQDDGEVNLSKDARLAYMAQSSQMDLEAALFSVAEEAYAPWFKLEERAKELMALGDDASLEEAADLHDQLAHTNFYQRAALIDATLRGLGFKAEDFTKAVKHFSSGWQMRVLLAQVLLSDAEILLLDEPSNFLDSESSLWLIDWLRRFSGGLLLVSHDRYFLDQVTTETFELMNGRLKRYAGSYSEYEVRREQEYERLFKLREQQESRLAEIDDFARRFGASPTKASLVQSRLREAEKIRENLTELPTTSKQMKIKLPKPPHAGERVLYMEGLSKSYGERTIFEDLTLLIGRSERIAVTGFNGAGKSTLLRILSGIEKADSGYLKAGTGVEIGYFSEDTHEPFLSKTVLGEMEAQAPLAMQPEVRNILGAFLFQGDDVYKNIAQLSGGEKARLLLARLFLKPFNLLILDEPTNHLDLQSKELLLQALKEYPGTLLFVSHDRYFSEQLASDVLHITKKPRFYPGGYSYYLDQLAKGYDAAVVEDKSSKKVAQPSVTQNQQDRLAQKADQARIRKLKKQEEALLLEIADLEELVGILQEKQALPEIYKDGLKMKELLANIKEQEQLLASKYDEWQSISEELS